MGLLPSNNDSNNNNKRTLIVWIKEINQHQVKSTKSTQENQVKSEKTNIPRRRETYHPKHHIPNLRTKSNHRQKEKEKREKTKTPHIKHQIRIYIHTYRELHGRQELLSRLIHFSVDLAVHAAALKLHQVLCQGTRFVAKDILDLTQVGSHV